MFNGLQSPLARALSWKLLPKSWKLLPKRRTQQKKEKRKHENKKERRKGKGIPFVGPSMEGPTRVGPWIYKLAPPLTGGSFLEAWPLFYFFCLEFFVCGAIFFSFWWETIFFGFLQTTMQNHLDISLYIRIPLTPPHIPYIFHIFHSKRCLLLCTNTLKKVI